MASTAQPANDDGFIQGIRTEAPKIPEQEQTMVQHVWCSVGISKKMEDVFVSFVLNQQQNHMNVSEYIVYLTSTGGNPFSGMALYNFIKAIPQQTTVYNMGIVASAAVPFFLAFDKRHGVPESSIMIHQTFIDRSQLPEQINVSELEKQKVGLAASDASMQKIIVKETSGRGSKSLTTVMVKNAFASTATYSASDAHKFGFIDSVVSPQIPNENVLYLTDQYLATQPG